jgi:hypothetical protein
MQLTACLPRPRAGVRPTFAANASDTTHTIYLSYWEEEKNENEGMGGYWEKIEISFERKQCCEQGT